MIRALLFACVAVCAASGQSGQPDPSAPGKDEPELRAARADMDAGRFEKASARFAAILKRKPDLPDALFGLGIAYSQLGKPEEAIRLLERYVRLEPASAEGHSVLGLVLLASGRAATARAELEQAHRLEPGLESAKALAHLEMADYNGSRALSLLKPFRGSHEFDREAAALLASAYAQAGDHRSALAVLSPLTGQDPPPGPGVFALAAASAYNLGDQAAAERACASGMRAWPDSDELEQRCLRIVSGAFVDALRQKVHSGKADLRERIILGRLLTDVAETAEAPVREEGLSVLKDAVRMAPRDARALYNLGRCLRVMARAEDALSSLNAALDARPEPEPEVLIQTQIGLAYAQLEKPQAATAAFEAAMALNRRLPGRLPQPAFSYYEFLLAGERSREAQAILEEILRWNAGFLPARMERARLLSERGNLEDAVREAEIVAQNGDPANQQLLRRAHILLMTAYARMGRTAESARHQAWLKERRR